MGLVPRASQGRALSQPGCQGQSSLDTAQGAALFLLQPPGSQLLLGQRHLLLHGRSFLFGPSAVLLEKGERGTGGPRNQQVGRSCLHPSPGCKPHQLPEAGPLGSLPQHKGQGLLFSVIQGRQWMIQSYPSCLSTALSSVSTYIFLYLLLCQKGKHYIWLESLT